MRSPFVRTVLSPSFVILAAVGASTCAAPAPPPDVLTFLRVEGRSNGTPSIAADGSFVAVAWGGTVEGKADVFLAVSRDEGRTFSAPARVNTEPGEARLGGELPPRVALHRAARGADPDITVLWTARGELTSVKLSRSRDGGRSFAAPAMLQSPDAPGNRGWSALALDAGGTAHAIWLDHRLLAPPPGEPRKPHVHGAKPAATHDGVAMSLKSGLYYAAAGHASRAEIEITRGVCYCCKTALTVAPDGALVAAWRQVYPGHLRDIAFSVSRDGGRSFSAPLQVSEDNWALNACPDDGPALAVDGAGTVHAVWPTVIDGPEPEGGLFYASLRTGAARFTPRIRIPTLGGPKPMHPQILVDRSGRIFVSWDEFLEERRVAALREVKLAAAGPDGFGSIVTLAEDESAAYPVLSATTSGIIVAWTSGEPSASTIGVRSLRLPR
jgi:hypothetical protein